ncbi:MAG: ABC transporter permease, partial [Muribaculaceae bacterium]|nr:ABC transporter permease [Muribaculaceae bacterium]
MIKIFISDLRRNIVKILCLTIGLAIGFILVAKIYFDKTYDSFFPDSDRIYMVTEMAEVNGEFQEYNQIPGGTAPGIKRYLPQVEAATRYTYLAPSGKITLADDRSFEINGVTLADSCFFDVFNVDIVAGDYKAVLSS